MFTEITHEKIQTNLFFLLADLKDFRRGQGRMHALPMVLIIFIMAAMSGFNGFRPTGDFIEKHRQELIKLFKPKNNRLPSFQTIARILENIDFDKLTEVFHRWTSSRVTIKKSEWCSLDALHCQKDTVKTIVKSKNHYVIGVKGNQKKLYSRIKKT